MRNCSAVGLTFLICFLVQCKATIFDTSYISFTTATDFEVTFGDVSSIVTGKVVAVSVAVSIDTNTYNVHSEIGDTTLQESYVFDSTLSGFAADNLETPKFVLKIQTLTGSFESTFTAKALVFEDGKLKGNYLSETSSFFLTSTDITLDASFGVTNSDTGEYSPCEDFNPEDPVNTKCTGSVTDPLTNDLIICTKTDTNIPTCSTSKLPKDPCDTDSDLEVTFELNNNDGTGNKFIYIAPPLGIAIINTVTCWDMTTGCDYDVAIVPDETITILNQVETDQCTKHDFTVLDMTITIVFTDALEISWKNGDTDEKKQFKLILELEGPGEDPNPEFPTDIHIDCADIANGGSCYAYAFSYDASVKDKAVNLVLSYATGDAGSGYEEGIMKTQKTIPIGGPPPRIGENQKSSLLKLLNLDIDWESSTNHLCLQDPTLSTMNESLYNYELVWATADGKWKKYTHYEIKNTHVCFDGIHIDQEEIESSPRVKILALKRDKNNKKVVGSDLVVADLTKPVVTPVTDHVIKVELGGVQHGFVIRDVATNHIITRDLGDMGAPTFLTANKDNGGVYNKHFILEMNNDGMKTRVHFFTPHITAAATRFQRHPVMTESQ